MKTRTSKILRLDDELKCKKKKVQWKIYLPDDIWSHIWHWSQITEASRYGDLDSMKWMKENGCPWDEDTFAEAA